MVEKMEEIVEMTIPLALTMIVLTKKAERFRIGTLTPPVGRIFNMWNPAEEGEGQVCHGI